MIGVVWDFFGPKTRFFRFSRGLRRVWHKVPKMIGVVWAEKSWSVGRSQNHTVLSAGFGLVENLGFLKIF